MPSAHRTLATARRRRKGLLPHEDDGRLYASTSYWNTPIPANPQIDPNSTNMVNTSLVAYGSGANLMNSLNWGNPLVYSGNDDPVRTITCDRYCPYGTTTTFRIPAGIQPSGGSDHHLAVINRDTGQELDMYQARLNGSNWVAGSFVKLDSNGVGACGVPGTRCLGTTAAGFANIGGAVMIRDIKRGSINHALAFTTPKNRANYTVCPATGSDGASTDPNSLPEAARIQLNPTFDVGAQSWPAWKKMIATALQTYGAYNRDNGGTIGVVAENPIHYPSGIWSQVGVTSSGLSDLPWSQMRVLTMTQC